MSEVNIEVVGGDELRQALSRFDAGMQKQLHEQLAQWAEKVRNEAVRLVPVRTGFLRSSIFARTREWNAEIGAEAAYAANVEFGTTYARAKPFLNPAVEAHLGELESAFLHALDSAKAEAEF